MKLNIIEDLHNSPEYAYLVYKRVIFNLHIELYYISQECIVQDLLHA